MFGFYLFAVNVSRIIQDPVQKVTHTAFISTCGRLPVGSSFPLLTALAQI